MKKPVAYVTDHAVLRYLQRVKGIDVDAARLELGHVVDRAIEAGAGATVIDGIRYVLDEITVITCTPKKMVPLRGRANRRRDQGDDDWEGQP